MNRLDKMKGQNWLLFGVDELIEGWRSSSSEGFWKAYWLLMMSWAPTNRVRRIKARRGRTLERPAFWVEEE